MVQIGCTLELGIQECTTVLQCAAAAPAPAAMRLIFLCIKLTHFQNFICQPIANCLSTIHQLLPIFCQLFANFLPTFFKFFSNFSYCFLSFWQLFAQLFSIFSNLFFFPKFCPGSKCHP